MWIFVKIDIEGNPLNYTRGNPDWPSVAQGEWIRSPYSKARWDVRYDRETGEWLENG